MATEEAKPFLPLSSEEISPGCLYIEDTRNVVENLLKEFLKAFCFSFKLSGLRIYSTVFIKIYSVIFHPVLSHGDLQYCPIN